MTALATKEQVQALQATRRRAGIDDDAWKDMVRLVSGQDSTRGLTMDQAGGMLDRLRGTAPARRPDGRLKLSGPFAPKFQALWIAGWNLGLVRNRDDAALVAFVTRQTGISHPRWVLDAEDAAKAIEALKSWLARDGGVDWSDSKYLPDHMRADGFRIARAQWAILGRPEADFWTGPGGVGPGGVLGIAGSRSRDLGRDGWITVMNRLGQEIRNRAGKESADG